MFARNSLAACPSCSCQFFVNEPACPHCGAVVRQGDGRGAQRTAATILLGLAVAAMPLAACGDDTSGGTGGDSSTGDGGDISVQSAYGIAPSSSGEGGSGQGGQGGRGDGGNDTVSGTGGEGGFGSGDGDGDGDGGGDPQECTVELVEPDAVCDAGCDGAFTTDTAKLCTFSCEDSVECPDSPDGTFECVSDGVNSVCAYTCAGGDACPNGFICDEEICFPDTPDA